MLSIRCRCRVSQDISLHFRTKGCSKFSVKLFAGVTGENVQTTDERSIEDLPGPHSDLQGIALAKKFFLNGLKILSFQQKINEADSGKIVLKAQLRNVEQFGPIFRTKFMGLRAVDFVKISNPVDVSTVLRSEGRIPIRPDSPVMEYYRKKTNKPAGIIFDNGLSWYKHRKCINERMLQPRSVADYEPAFNKIVTEFVARLERLRGSHGLENEIPSLEEELFKWSFESVSLMLFDERFGALEDQIHPEVKEFISAVNNFLQSTAHIDVQPLWLHKIFQTKMYKQFAESYDKFYEFTDKAIKRKLMKFANQGELSQPPQGQIQNIEILKYLVLASDLTHEDLLATYVDVYFAGVDTTATSVLWCLYELAKNPDKQLNLYQEISSVLKPGELVTNATLSKLPYLKACIKEVLRLYSIFFLARVTEQDLLLSGYKIPSGTHIMILNHAMSLSEQYFEDPLSFTPERWLRESKNPSESGRNINAFASLPFGFGTRMCIGRRVTELEQYLLLTRLIQNYQLLDATGETVEKTTHGLVIIPDRPVRVQFLKRKESLL